jgi:hypothetical protein
MIGDLEQEHDAEIRRLALDQIVSLLKQLQTDVSVNVGIRQKAKMLMDSLDASGLLIERLKNCDLLDGGVNENTGIATIWEVIQHLRYVAHGLDPFLDKSAQSKAKGILDKLTKRGIVFIEIDSGAKPAMSEVAELRTPIQGLENASYANANYAKSWYLKNLNEILTKERQTRLASTLISGLLPPPLWRERFECNHSQDRDVMTAWALGPMDKARVVATFFCEYIMWKQIVLPYYRDTWLKPWESFRDLQKSNFLRIAVEAVNQKQLLKQAMRIQERARQKAGHKDVLMEQRAQENR